ncbi:MAG: FAD-dependent monooxygenase, partial [Acidobacteriia bacterium]|nr:FAD-dependent monooxygenase [Terriglobia bacterium]
MSAGGKFAIIGAGIGGLALAGLLARRGIEFLVYEQASAFERIGAGIQMSPNAMRVLRALGIEPLIRQLAFAPRSWSNRVWDSGAPLFDLTFGPEAERRYGAPYLLMHRGDLHAALLSAMPRNLLLFSKLLVGLDRMPDRVILRFADGSRAAADAVVGADGVHSKVREVLLGPERPRFIGRVAHRTVFPSSLMRDYLVETCTKWWGPDRHIVIYPVNPRRDETYFVTSVP